MPSIGDTLREARMRQRLDIADVEERTKIRAKYLRALENEEFGLLPGTTFAKTFLRTYAEVLGLDPHVLVEEYRANYEPRDELDLQALGPAPRARRERELRYPGPPSRGVAIGALVLGLLAFLIVLGVTGEDEGDGEDRRAADTVTRTERTEPRERRRPRPATPSSVSLRVAPTVPTYLCVDTGAGTEIVYQGILQEPRTFKEEALRVNLGKTSVELRVNGKPFPLEPAPNPVGFEFDPKGSKELPAGQRPCAGGP
jgi:cytoskeleton protein RodZ